MKNTNDTTQSENQMCSIVKKNKKTFFTLTRKNQNGQIAIFVALIFQVVFVFFALLINVGLIVHHKINLQQSTDLAAYYGAMKQAEMLNVISHVNFQVRQAWKLLAWRYRIAGTFGMYSKDPQLHLPVQNLTTAPIPDSGDSMGFNNAPALCISHIGMGDWPGPTSSNENFCRTTASQINGASGNVISAIQRLTGTQVTGAGTAPAINSAIGRVNQNLEQVCDKTTELGSQMLSVFLDRYGADKDKKLQTLQALFKNLSNERQKFIDLNGDLVEKGVKNTFDNNLTEANKASAGTTFKVINGVSDDFTACAGCKDQNYLYSEIVFRYLAFFRLECESRQRGQNNTPAGLESIRFKYVSPDSSNAGRYVIGVEKNPWYQVYYGVRAQTEPVIPFLPMSRIKLSAVSFAKPFGGSVGPRFNATWSSDQNQSSGGSLVDAASPLRNAVAVEGQTQAAQYTINFSNYVGDQKGLSDSSYISKYHLNLLSNNKIGFNRASVRMGGWGVSSGDGLYVDGLVRNLELSAIAPNQFDVAYYSIEPDFKNNYFKNKMEPNSNFKRKLEENTGVSGLTFSEDYGGGIKEQLMQSGFNNYAAKKLQTLLTGWTFVNLTNAQGYVKFPDVNSQTTMPFAKCNDNVDAFDQTVSSPKPPTPGNCVNGGRTGYSVKIVSQDLLNGPQGPIGGEGTQDQLIRNPVPDQFLNFQ